jgi:hypothetical protein
MTTNTTLADDVEVARSVAFMLAQAEASLGIRAARSLPFDTRIAHVLHGAASAPERVSPDTYRALYMLHRAGTE